MASQDMNISADCSAREEEAASFCGKLGVAVGVGGGGRWEVFGVGALRSTPIELGQLTMKRIKNATAPRTHKKIIKN